MALAKQVVPISFVGGIDTKTDPKQVVATKLLLLENGIFKNKGELQKRNGYMGLDTLIEGSSSNITAGTAAASFKDEINLFSGTKMYSRSDATMRWTDKGYFFPVSISANPIIRNTNSQTNPDGTIHPTGLQAFVWEDSSGGSRYALVDLVTGEYLIQNALIAANAERPKAIALGNYIIIMYRDTVSNNISYFGIPVLTPLVPTATQNIATNVSIANPNYDATLTGDRLFVAYNNSTGGTSVRYLNFFLVLSVELIVAGEASSSCITVFGDPTLQQVWVVYHNGAAVKYFITDYSATTTLVLSPTVIEAIVGPIKNITGVVTSAGLATIYYTVVAVSASNDFVKTANLTNLGVVSGIAVFIRSVGIAGKAFIFNGTIYFVVAHQSTLQPTYFLLNSLGNVIAKFNPDVGGGIPTKSMVPEITEISEGKYLLATGQKDLLVTISGALYSQTGVTAISIDLVQDNVFQKAELASNLHLTGGFVSMYDGVSVVEHGYHVFPEDVLVVTSGAGGVITAGQYQYSVTYEWTDNQGQNHISAPSVPTTITTVGATSSNTLTIPTLRLTNKKPPTRSNVIIGVYRTEANGTVFYKVSSLTSPTYNNTTVDTVSFVDTLADTAIIGNPLLYTTGGVVENISAPATDLAITFKNRVIIVPSENPLSFWYSKEIVPGVPVEFSDLFQQNIDQNGGPITALAQLDDKLILFKQTSIMYVTGSGPDATGSQNDFSPAQLVSADGGCIDPNSVVLIPEGLMYKSQKGIYLLGRGLQVVYIGADVEAFNSNNIISAQLIPMTNQVRFILDNQTALVYDYYFQQWSVFTHINAVDSTIFQNKFTYLRPSGLMLQETPGEFSDNGEFVRLKLTTSWLSFAGIQGFQRVRHIEVLGEYISPHQLITNVSYDFNENSTQQDIINTTNLLDTGTYGSDAYYGALTPYGGEFPLYQFRIDLQRQKCESIQLSIEDTQSSNFGEGFSISAMSLEAGVKQGLNKLQPSRSFG